MSTKQFGPSVSERSASTTPVLPGDTLAGRYRIERPLAEGGMGIVYAARDTTLDRPVAVKVLQADWARLPDFAERFEREARAASRINHPHCIVVHDFGKSERGLYLVMEWIDGRSLAAVLAQEGALAPERATALMLQIGSGLAAAHACGIIHRDIKPQNVMVVVPQGGAELAKLIDFGIARMSAKEAPKLTQTGMSIGSPDFMSPEQALGEECDARSDVYSATGVFYAMLTGKKPYDAKSSVDVMHQHLHGVVPSLAGSAVARFEPIIARGMAKSPGERFASAQALADAIRATASLQAIAVASPRLPRLPSWRPTRRMTLIAGGILAALGVIWGLGRGGGPRYPEVEQALSDKAYRQALDKIDALSADHPGEPRLALLKGHALSGLSEPADARTAYAVALKAEPKLASDAQLQLNALPWLDGDSEAAVTFWRDSIGSAGLPALRKATLSDSHDLRANAVQLREALHDPQAVDYLAVYTLDVTRPDHCTTRARAAKKLQQLGDKRAIPALRAAKEDMGPIDRLCIGSAVDDALKALGATE